MAKKTKPPLKVKNKSEKHGGPVAAAPRRKMSVPTGEPRRAFTARLPLEMYRDLRQTAVDMDCPIQLVVDSALSEYFAIQKAGGRGRGRGLRRLPVDPLTTVTNAERPLIMSALSILRSRVVEARALLSAFLSHWDKLKAKNKAKSDNAAGRRLRRRKVEEVSQAA